MKRYALVIGIGDYDHLPPLSKPKSDAAAMQDVLQTNNHFEVTLLNKGVTREKLRDALETLLLKRGKNSDVLIYFTGHGFTAGEDEDEAQGYLATQDCRIEIEGKRVLSARRGFSFQALNKLIAKAELSSLVMLLDCCHSGSFIESAQARETLGALNTRYFLVTACRSFEQAAAMKTAENSIFSAAVLAALQADGVRITGLDVLRRVESDLQGTGQEPLYLGAGSDIPIVERRVAVTTVVSEECPYQGLRAFTPETEKFFFGREAEKRLLWERLSQSNFVAVLGPSGIGKSSVVRAGLVTRLVAEGWQVLPMMPEDQPMANLKSAVKPLWAEMPVGEQRRLREVLQGEGLLAMAQQLSETARQPNRRVLLLVDQFEEVFTQCLEGKEAERDSFIRGLVAVGRAQTPLAVVMTMRSDFVNEWLATGQPPEVMNRDTVYLGPLQGENLTAAIVEPATMQGYRFGTGLFELLLDDVAKEANCLPLLEFALQELWNVREIEKKELTAAAYVEIGRLNGALDKQAERIFTEKLLRDVDRDWARRICLELVRIGRGERDTRQRQPKEKLLQMGGSHPEKKQIIADVIAELVKGRRLVSGGDENAARDADNTAYIDLAHEALLEGWTQFATWRQEDRDLQRLKQRLADAYEEWEKKESNDHYLLAGGLLAEVREQQTVLKDLLADEQSELMRYFSLSDEREQKKVAALEQALSKAEIQEASRKVRDKLLSTPAQTVEATISAMALVGKSQTDFASDVVYPAQDALHRAWFTIRERLKLEGHSGSVLSVAFSPQGDRIVSGSSDHTLRLWDLKGNPVGKAFRGHSGVVASVAFNPQGDQIVSGSYDNTLRLWDLSGNCIGNPFHGHSSWVYKVVFSPDGDRIISGGDDSAIQVWDLEGRSVGKPFGKSGSIVEELACNPAGDMLVSVSSGDIFLWQMNGHLIYQFPDGFSTDLNNLIKCVAFSPDGSQIVSGGNGICLYDLLGRRIGNPFFTQGSQVTQIAFNSKGDQIVSGSADGSIRLWTLDGELIEAPFFGHNDEVESIGISLKDDRLVSGSRDGTIRLWSMYSKSPFETLVEQHSPISTAAFNLEGDKIIVGSLNNPLRLWDLDGSFIGTSLKEIDSKVGPEKYTLEYLLEHEPTTYPFSGHIGRVLSVAFNGKENKIVSSGKDSTIRLWDLKGNLVGNPFLGHDNWIYSVAFNCQGNRIVSGSGDRTLRLWDLEGHTIGTPFKGHSRAVLSVAFEPRGSRVVSGSDDGTLRLWDLEGHTIGIPFEGHRGSVNSVAFSPGGSRIVSGSDDGTLRLWDLEGNTIGIPFEGHRGSVNSVAFSPRGSRIVSGSDDGTLRLWDLEGNTIGTPFEGHFGSVETVVFSPRGTLIASGGRDGTLRLWRVNSWEDELRHCCSTLMHHTALTLPQTETASKACEVCEQVWTQQQSAEFLVAQGSALARRGEVEEAISKFNRAKALDSELTLDSAVRANELAEWG